MRRVVLLLAIAMLAIGCAAPAPSAMPQPASPPPTAANTPALTTSPSPVQTPDATASLDPTATPTEVFPGESEAPPLEVDFSTAPTFPSPILVVGKTRTSAIGESGCPTIIYEPADDVFGRQAGMQEPCGSFSVLTSAKPVSVSAGYPLVFRAPKDWVLSAQVVFATDPYGPFWIIEATRRAARPGGATPLAGIVGEGQVEIGRGEGLREDEIDAMAPTEPGEYLVTVQAQVGQVPTKWRTYDRTYYYWIRVP
jgi:hypothetical protein